MTECQFKPGDPIAWTYTHALNSRNRVRLTKTGVFVRLRAKPPSYGNGPTAIVRFRGNKTDSRVPLAEIRAYKDGGEE